MAELYEVPSLMDPNVAADKAGFGSRVSTSIEMVWCGRRYRERSLRRVRSIEVFGRERA